MEIEQRDEHPGREGLEEVLDDLVRVGVRARARVRVRVRVRVRARRCSIT